MQSSSAAFEPLGAGDPRLIGGYRVLARIGAGGVGRVFLATTQSGRRLAIKLVRPELAGDETFRTRFQREVGAAQRVRSPYVAQVVDAHPAGPERPWMATVHVPGPSLAHVLAVGGPLPTNAARALFAGLATGLQALHDADLAHGDLKPSNVLLASDGPRIVDIGIGCAAAAVRPSTRSPLFTAPEQGDDGGIATPAADVFALGNLVYFAATGRTAFGAPSDAVQVQEISYDQPDLAGCPSSLRGLISRCLATDPADRPPLAAVLADLEQAPPGPGWLPSSVEARIPAYEAEPPAAEPAPLPDPAAPAPAPASASPSAPNATTATLRTSAMTATTAPEFAPVQTPPVPGGQAPGGGPGPGSTKVLSQQELRPDILPPAEAPFPAYLPAMGATTPDLPYMAPATQPGSNLVLLAAGGVLAVAVVLCALVVLAFVL